MRTIKINYIPYKKDKKGLTVKNYAFSKINQGLEILENITLLEIKTIMFLTSFQKLPTSSNKTKLRRIDTQDQIIKCINTNRKSFGDTIKSLEKKNYLIITDDEYILNVDQIEKDIQNVWENKVSSILKDDDKFKLSERELKHFKSLEKLIAADLADEDDLKEYEELKALLQGSDDKEEDLEVNEQETITNNTKEIVEKTQIEADLDVKKEFKHKDTTSTPETEKTAKTEQKEVIKEDTSNDINKYKNICLELSNYQIPNYEKETSKDNEVDNNKEEKTNEMITQETLNLFNELLQLTEGTDLNSKKENIRIKISDWKRINEKNYSNEYYRDIALNRFLKEEIEKYKIYDTVSDVEEVKVIEDYSNEESIIRNSNDSYAEALKILINRFSNDNLNEEEITKEFNSFFGTFYEKKSLNDVLFVYEQVKSKYSKNAA